MNSEPQDFSQFPEDRDAPNVNQNKSFFNKFYERYRNPVDILVFSAISISTLITVSLSIYIIIVKFL